MGDESMVSGMSEGGPPGAAGAGVGAEGIMKKLSNYWFIVGSIPLVMFMLVCLPTVFYVKSISEYKNAYYCRSKACDTLAEVTKTAREAKPCDDYFGAVCPAAKAYTIKDIVKKDTILLSNAYKIWGDQTTLKKEAANWASQCKGGDALGAQMDPAATLTALSGIDVTNFKDGIGKADTHKTIFENAQKYGIDCLFHLEWVHSGTKRLLTDGPRPTIGENHPPDPTTPHYDLAFIEYCKDLDFTAAPVMVRDTDFGLPPAGVQHNVQVNFKELIDKVVPDYKRFLVRSPNYLRLLTLAVNTCEAGKECQITLEELTIFMALDVLLKYQAYIALVKLDQDVRQLWCLRIVDFMVPTGLNVVAEKYLKETYWPYALNNPKDPKAFLPSSGLGYKYMTMLLDSFQHSYALSAASSEKSRAGLYLKSLQMDYFAFYKNSSDKVDEEYLKVVAGANPSAGDFNLDTLWKARQEFYKAYWDTAANKRLDPKYFIGRHPLMFGDDEGSYDYGTNVMYVPFGMFRPHFYRDSMAYMGNYATFGYYGSMNIMKLLDNKGGYTKAGYQHPVLWTGTYAMSKLNWQYRCLNSAKANNTDARLVAKGTRPLSPGFRTYCPYKKMKDSVNKMFQHDLYYQKAYCSETGKLKKPAKDLCYIWHSTRREY